MIVLDTNVLSEALRPAPDAKLRAWLGAQPATSLFATAVSQAEMLYGLLLLPMGHRRRALEAAIQAIFEVDFADRVLPFDSPAARAFAAVAADRRKAGWPVSSVDAFIAGIARSRNASVATRNVTDFSECGIEVIDPWLA